MKRRRNAALVSVQGGSDVTLTHRVSDEPGGKGRLVPMDLLQPFTAAQQVAGSNACAECARERERGREVIRVAGTNLDK